MNQTTLNVINPESLEILRSDRGQQVALKINLANGYNFAVRLDTQTAGTIGGLLVVESESVRTGRTVQDIIENGVPD